MTPRRQARLDAVAALLALGWAPERIALALTMSLAMVRRLMPKQPRPRAQEGCCRIIADPRLGTARYCDDPTAMPGAVYCARHTHGGVWAS